MMELAALLKEKGVELPQEIRELLQRCKSYRVFNTVDELNEASTNGKENAEFEVKYDVPGKGLVTEAIVHRVSNGISANYTEMYMRRRDPNTMAIADNLPTDKETFKSRFGYEFEKLEGETYKWLESQDLGVFFYFAGRCNIGCGGIAIVPANAAFFAYGLSMLQEMRSLDEIDSSFKIESALYVIPPFRHTHFDGKQVVVHRRTEGMHEVFAYNLYPGPSAKKGLYSVLIDKGEKEGWITTHCSTVQVASPYDNMTTYMHEGASGGGKSEMLQHIVREEDGQILLGENITNGEHRHITIPMFCKLYPVTDDMGLCHPSAQKGDGKLGVIDAENSWFIRVDGITNYGDDPALEKLTIKPQFPLMFLNVDTKPGGTALVWNHIEDAPGKRCANPRVIVPRKMVPNVIEGAVSVDVRSFGVRTPPCTLEKPSYGIVGIFHLLPPALAWLWRLVAPRGHANPSIIGGGDMASEGVGSYWPFATGLRVKQANLLLEQIIQTPRTQYTLTPNQHIGCWKVGFKPQQLMREYLTRRGNAKLRKDQYQPARCPLLGYELNYLSIEGAKIPSRFLKVYRQTEIGEEGYDKGAAILNGFFKHELAKFLTPELHPMGRQIIEACMNDASVEDYIKIIPMDYQYNFPAPAGK